MRLIMARNVRFEGARSVYFTKVRIHLLRAVDKPCRWWWTILGSGVGPSKIDKAIESKLQ